MSIAWFVEIKRGPSVVPTKGASDGPSRAYPTVGPPGRGYNHFVLPGGRCLPPAQPQSRTLRLPQATLGLGDPRPRALPTAPSPRVRALFLARGRPLFLSSVSGDRGLLAVLVPPARAQTEGLPGALAACDPRGIDGRALKTMIVDSTLLPVLHPRQVSQGSGFEGAAWVRWGSFCVYGVKLHMLCTTNRIPLSYELTPANVADLSLTEELLAEASFLGEEEEVARRLFADLAYQSEQLEEGLAEVGILLVTERAKQRRGARQQIELAFASLKRVFGLG